MSSDGIVKKLYHRTVLQTQALHYRQNAFHEAAPVGAMAAKRTSSPQDGPTLHSFGMIVRRLYSLYGDERPQARKNFLHPRAMSPCLRVVAAHAAAQHFQELQHQGQHFVIHV